MKINKAKRALQHMKALGTWQYTKKPTEAVKPHVRAVHSHVELSRIMRQVKADLRGKK